MCTRFLIKKSVATIGATCLTLSLLGCATVATKSPANVSPGDSQVIAAHEKVLGFGRTYRLHVPLGVASNPRPRPLVIALHGGVASARIFEQQTGLSQLADERDFFVVYPNGIGIFGLLRHWNARWCCAKAMRAQIDDPAFVDRVVDDVQNHWSVDPERIFVVGYSNGGMLAHQYAATRSERLAGLAVFAGPAGTRNAAGDIWAIEPESPLPALVIHGKADERLDYAGDSPARPSLGADDSARIWALSNGCSASPKTETVGAVERLSYCKTSPTPVEVLLLDGWGHEWPGPRGTGKLAVDHPLADFDLGREIWSFFAQLASNQIRPSTAGISLLAPGSI